MTLVLALELLQDVDRSSSAYGVAYYGTKAVVALRPLVACYG